MWNLTLLVFTVKDLASRRPLLRCDSAGPLYTLRFPAAPSSSSPSLLSAAFAASTSSTTWHRRLGHPGRDALIQLSRSSGLPCNAIWKCRTACGSYSCVFQNL
jgi:hypothetical protein